MGFDLDFLRHSYFIVSLDFSSDKPVRNIQQNYLIK